jgi:hypothetical protein
VPNKKHRMSNIIWCDRNVRFGSKTDMCGAQADVRFVPIADVPIVRLSRNETPRDVARGFSWAGTASLERGVQGEQSRRYRGAVSCKILSQKASSSRYTIFVVAIR